MPLFEYQCEKCDAREEVLVSAARRDEARPCPRCKGGTMHRVLSTFSGQVREGGGAGRAPACDSCCPTGTCPFN